MEEFEILKRTIANMIMNREISPEVNQIINKLKDRILGVYEERGLKVDSIQEYVYSEFGVLKSAIRQIGSKKNDKDLEEVMNLIDIIQRRMEDKQEEISDNASAFAEDEKIEERRQILKNEDQIINLPLDNRQTANNMAMKLEDFTTSIRNMATRTLTNRGVSDRVIEQTWEEIVQIVHEIDLKTVDDLFKILGEEDRKVLESVAKQYEMYEEASRVRKTKHQEFAEKLDAGISLQEQSDNAKAFQEREEERKNEDNEYAKGLPDDVIY